MKNQNLLGGSLIRSMMKENVCPASWCSWYLFSCFNRLHPNVLEGISVKIQIVMSHQIHLRPWMVSKLPMVSNAGYAARPLRFVYLYFKVKYIFSTWTCTRWINSYKNLKNDTNPTTCVLVTFKYISVIAVISPLNTACQTGPHSIPYRGPTCQ